MGNDVNFLHQSPATTVVLLIVTCSIYYFVLLYKWIEAVNGASDKPKLDLWTLRFALQAEADPTLKVPAGVAWAAGIDGLQLGEVAVEHPGELLLEGMGRALTVFAPIERGIDSSTPESMQLTPAEAFVLVRTAARQLRDVGVGVELPPSLSGGLASRLGLSIKAELSEKSRGFTLGENLDWEWELMIGLITIESDTQSADNVTGVVTAAGNVKIVYPSRGMVATARQAQYFSQEGRLVLTGDVDVVQEGGNALRAERVVYLLEQERTEAIPPPGQQVFSQMVIQSGRPTPTPLTP